MKKEKPPFSHLITHVVHSSMMIDSQRVNLLPLLYGNDEKFSAGLCRKINSLETTFVRFSAMKVPVDAADWMRWVKEIF